MSPLRLLILAGLGYILYRLLFGGQAGSRAAGRPSRVGGGGQPADDVLVQDPVCHTYIPQQGAESWTCLETTYYFCSPECRKKFQTTKGDER